MHASMKPGVRHSKPEVYQPNPSYVPGDIIKEPVVEKPTYERVYELVSKRYRMEKISNQVNIHLFVQKSLSQPTAKEAAALAVENLIRVDGSDINVILNQTEINARNAFNNKKMLLVTILSAIKAGQTRASIVISINRQLAMRKLTNYIADPMVQDILSLMMQKRLIQQKSVSAPTTKSNGLQSLKAVVIEYTTTDEGNEVLTMMTHGTKDQVKKAVDNFELRYNFA